MSAPEPRYGPWGRVLIVTGALVVIGGLLLTFSGVGAELREEREVAYTLAVPDLDREVSAAVEVGDPIYTDFGGVKVGEVATVQTRAMPLEVPDAQGRLHEAASPVLDEVRMTVVSQGRVGENFVAIGGQVLLVGQQLTLISEDWRLTGVVTGVDVR